VFYKVVLVAVDAWEENRPATRRFFQMKCCCCCVSYRLVNRRGLEKEADDDDVYELILLLFLTDLSLLSATWGGEGGVQ